MKKLLYLLCAVACLPACATSSMTAYQVNSTPPGAQIYVNHVLMGVTPIQIELQCDKQWVCAAGSHCQWEFHGDEDEVTAYPPDNNLGPSQTQRVKGCRIETESAHVDFDFGRGQKKGKLVKAPAEKVQDVLGLKK